MTTAYLNTIKLDESWEQIKTKPMNHVTYDEIKDVCECILSNLSSIHSINMNDDCTLCDLINDFEVTKENCFDCNSVFDDSEEACSYLSFLLSNLKDWANTEIKEHCKRCCIKECKG